MINITDVMVPLNRVVYNYGCSIFTGITYEALATLSEVTINTVPSNWATKTAHVINLGFRYMPTTEHPTVGSPGAQINQTRCPFSLP